MVIGGVFGLLRLLATHLSGPVAHIGHCQLQVWSTARPPQAQNRTLGSSNIQPRPPDLF